MSPQIVKSFWLEVARTLSGYIRWRDNNAGILALPIMDALINIVTIDEKTRKRWCELTGEEFDRTHTIQIPKELVDDFRSIFHGPRKDGELALKYLAPVNSLDLEKGRVVIRKPVNFLQAWGRHNPEQIETNGGFYTKQIVYQSSPHGLIPIEQTVPTIDWQDPALQYYETDTVPIAWWFDKCDKGWSEISPICTMIEKHIRKILEDGECGI